MLTIERAIVDKIIAHARADHPDEACGIVAGPEGSDRPVRFIPMTNAERSPTLYRFDSTEQFRVWNEMWDRDEEPIVIYHSHTATEAYPSRTDVSQATVPDAHYLLVSTRDADDVEVRSYRIRDGEVTEEEVRVVESYDVAERAEGREEAGEADRTEGPGEVGRTEGTGEADRTETGTAGIPEEVEPAG